MGQVEINTQGVGTFPLNYFPQRSFPSVDFPVVTFGGTVSGGGGDPPIEIVTSNGQKNSYVLNRMKLLTNRLKL